MLAGDRAARACRDPTPVTRSRTIFRRRLLLLLVLTAVVLVAVVHGGGHAADEVALDPSAFAPGACEAFAPTSGDRDRTVFLDAGHGGIDPGGTGTTEAGRSIDESNVNLAVELQVMSLLRADGFKVAVSRTENSTVMKLGHDDTSDGELSLQGAHADVAARDICANRAHADLLVGIYMDSGASAANAGSVTVYDADRSFSQANLRFARLLQKDVLSTVNTHGWKVPDDGVQADSTFGSYVGSSSSGGLAAAAAAYNHLLLLGPADPGFFSTPSKMPGAVIEPLYLSDPFEASIAASQRGRQAIARGIASAVEQYFTQHSRR
jgi:N-acetylmuramoyl-L-alanine amidase